MGWLRRNLRSEGAVQLCREFVNRVWCGSSHGWRRIGGVGHRSKQGGRNRPTGQANHAGINEGHRSCGVG